MTAAPPREPKPGTNLRTLPKTRRDVAVLAKLATIPAARLFTAFSLTGNPTSLLMRANIVQTLAAAAATSTPGIGSNALPTAKPACMFTIEASRDASASCAVRSEAFVCAGATTCKCIFSSGNCTTPAGRTCDPIRRARPMTSNTDMADTIHGRIMSGAPVTAKPATTIVLTTNVISAVVILLMILEEMTILPLCNLDMSGAVQCINVEYEQDGEDNSGAGNTGRMSGMHELRRPPLNLQPSG